MSGTEKKGTLIILTAAICVAAIVFILTKTVPVNARHAEASSSEKAPVHLNDTLTNSMSGFDGDESMDVKIENFMKRWDIKGSSLAVMRNDSLLLAKGYGWADEETGEKMGPDNILRMASVSKLITATGIMVLCERGAMSLQDTVFGPDGILDDTLFTASIREKSTHSGK